MGGGCSGMSSIDDRVVKMTFDNAQFEKNVGTTLATLGKLKAALNFEGSSKGLGDLQTKASNFTMEAMASSIQSIANRFSILGMTAQRILQDIVDKAVDAGERIGKALTIEPVISGLQEYETQINAVQTILANTKDKLVKNEGLTEEHDQIERINEVLDDLNKYADMTIYNFTEMTRNIGTFTAAGVELGTAQRAIKGIANLAAVSGSDSNQASRAMYQLSQALAAGVVHLQDWNSVVNAGMGGEVFQNAIIETARAKGVEIDEMMEEVGGSFRALLNAQDFGDWLTSDILLESLEKFTAGSEGFTKEQVKQQEELWRARGYSEEQIRDLVGSLHILTDAEEEQTRALWRSRGYTEEQIDGIMSLGKMSTEAATKVKTFTQLIDTVKEAMQSGWTQSWEYVIGDFEQAKILWTEISDILNLYIGKSADARNEMLKAWSTGRTDENGNNIDVGGTGREKVIAGIRNAFQGVYEILLVLNDAWDKSFWHKGMRDDLSITVDTLINWSDSFMTFTQEFKNALVVNGEATPLLEEIGKIAEKVFGSLRNVANGFINLGTIVGRFVTSAISSVVSNFELLSSNGLVYDYISKISTAFSSFTAILESKVFTSDVVTNFFDALGKAAKVLFEIKMDVALAAWNSFDRILREITNNYSDSGNFINSLSDGILRMSTAIESALTTESGLNRIDELFKNVTENITTFIDGVQKLNFDGFDTWINNLIGFIEQHPDVIFNTIQNILQGLVNIGESLYGVFYPLLDAFLKTFVVSDIVTYVERFSEVFRNFTESIKIKPENMQGIQSFFKGIFDVIKLIVDIILDSAIGAFNGFGDALGSLLPSQGNFTHTLGDIGEVLSLLVTKIRELLYSKDGMFLIGETFSNLGSVIGNFIAIISKGSDGPTIFDKLKAWLSNLNFSSIADAWKKFIEGLKTGFSNSKSELNEGSSILEKIGNVIGFLIDAVKKFTEKVDINGVISSLASLFTARSMMQFVDFITQLPDKISKFFGVVNDSPSLMKKFTNVLDELKKALQTWQETLNVIKIVAIAGAISAIAYSVYEVTKLDTDKVTVAMGALTVGIGEMLAAFVAANATSSKIGNSSMSSVFMILAMAHVFKQIADTIVDITTANGDTQKAVDIFGQMVLDVIIAFSTMAYAVNQMDRTKGLISAGVSLVLIGAALNIVAGAVKKLADINPESITQGIVALGFALGELVGALLLLTNFGNKETSKKFGLGEYTSSKPTNLIAAAASMILMGAALNIVADAVNKLSQLSPEKMAQGIIGVGFALGELVGALLLLTNFGNKESATGIGKGSITSSSSVDLMVAAQSMVVIVQALSMLANVVDRFAALSLEKLAQGLGGVGVALGALVASLLLLVNFGDGGSSTEFGGGKVSSSGSMDLIQGAASMILIGVALNVVANAVEKLAALSPEALARSIGAVSVSLGELVAALLLLVNFGGTDSSKSGGTTDIIKSAVSMILIGEALKIIASAVIKFSVIDPSGLATGLLGMAAALVEIIAVVRNMPEASEAITSGISLMILGAGLHVIVGAVQKFSEIDPSGLATGLLGMAAALVEIIAAVRNMPKAEESIPAAIAVILMGTALNIVANAVEQMSNIDMANMAVGLGGLAAVLAEMGIALAAFVKIGDIGTVSDEITGFSPQIMQAAGAMLVMASAIGVMAPALALLSTIPLPGLGVALLAVAGGFGAFAGIAAIIQPVIPAIFSLSASIAILSIGVFTLVAAFTLVGQLLAGMGPAANQAVMNIVNLLVELTPKLGEFVTAFLTSIFTTVQQTFPAFLQMIQTIIVSIFTTFVQTVTTLMPQLILLIGTIVSSIAIALQMNGGIIYETIKSFISGVLQLVIELAPKFGEAATTVINTILTSIQATMPQLGKTVSTVINTILTTFNEVSPNIINTVLGFITNLLKAVAEYGPQMASAGLQILAGFLNAIAENMDDIVTAAVNVIVNFVNGITENLPKIIDAAFKMIIGFIDGLATAIEENHDAFFDAVGHLIKAIVDAIIDGIGKVVSAGSELIGDFIDNFNAEQFMTDITNAGSNLIQGFIDGIGSLGENLWNAACDIANTAINAITTTTDQHSPSKVTFGQGANVTQGFIDGISSLTGQLSSTASGVATTALESLSGLDTATLSPSITPVIDTSSIQEGIDLNGLDLSGANLTDVDLSSLDFSNVSLDDMDMSNIDLTSMMGDFDIQGAYGDLGSNIDTNFGDLTSSNQGMTDSIVDAISSGNSSTSSDMSASTDRVITALSSMIETLKSLDVVLDSGKLVGELTPAIDKSLGNISMLAGRGVV